MHIKRLTIRNFRNFGDPAFVIDLKPFTLILGENNVGKTNLLNAIGLIFCQEVTTLRKRSLDLGDINNETLRRFKRQVHDISVSPEKVVFPEVEVAAVLTDMDADQDGVVANWFVDKGLTEAKITYKFAPKASFAKTEWIAKQREALRSQKPNGADLVDLPLQEYRYTIFGGDDVGNECEAYWLRMLKMECLEKLPRLSWEFDLRSGNSERLYATASCLSRVLVRALIRSGN